MDNWQHVLESIEKRVNKQSFATWFRPTKLVSDSDGALVVSVPNTLFLEWISSNYRKVVDEVIAKLEPKIRSVEFICESESAIKPPARKATMPMRLGRGGGSAAFSHRSSIPLNPKYRFSSFVVSSCNQFAHAAAMSVAEKPSQSYNPLYIYGGVGLGKTHILHAIGNYLAEAHGDAVLRYVTAENFMNELINSIRFEKTHEFKEKYRNVDVLLIDDVQFLEGKERTQEEFFHTFNQLYELQKQIVLTSDCPPREISTLEERLRSRFEMGLIADIQPPDLETKVAILRKKAEAEGVPVPQEVALYIASKVKSNVRELEGCLVRVIAYASLTGRPIDIDLAAETLKNIVAEGKQVVTVESIQKMVADYYRLKVAELRMKNNAKQVAMPRHIAMYLAKKLTSCSLPEIGRRFGGKHHSTVLHAIRKITRLRSAEPDFDKQMETFLESLQ